MNLTSFLMSSIHSPRSRETIHTFKIRPTLQNQTSSRSRCETKPAAQMDAKRREGNPPTIYPPLKLTACTSKRGASCRFRTWKPPVFRGELLVLGSVYHIQFPMMHIHTWLTWFMFRSNVSKHDVNMMYMNGYEWRNLKIYR